MGDSTNLTFYVSRPPAILHETLIGYFEHEAGSRDSWFTDEVSEEEILLGANEVRVCTVDTMVQHMDSLRENGEIIRCPKCDGSGEVKGKQCKRCNGKAELHVKADLAFYTYEDPKYEWLGSYRLYVPGLPLFASECDADGNVVVSADELVSMVQAATSLDQLKVDIASKTDAGHRAAMGKLKLHQHRHLESKTGMVHERFEYR